MLRVNERVSFQAESNVCEYVRSLPSNIRLALPVENTLAYLPLASVTTKESLKDRHLVDFSDIDDDDEELRRKMATALRVLAAEIKTLFFSFFLSFFFLFSFSFFYVFIS